MSGSDYFSVFKLLSYRQGMVVRGILYLHDVSQIAECWKARRSNLNLLAHLCGEKALNKVALVSTRWEKVHPDIIDERLRSLGELSLGGGLWAPMISGGASMHHLRPVFGRDIPSSQQSPVVMQEAWDPWRIISPFFNDGDAGRCPLLVQDEMVNRNLPFERTAVSRILGMAPKSIFSDVGGSGWDRRFEGGGNMNAGRTSVESQLLPRAVASANGLKTWIRRMVRYLNST